MFKSYVSTKTETYCGYETFLNLVQIPHYVEI